jgi:hypothetical protein
VALHITCDLQLTLMASSLSLLSRKVIATIQN